MLFGLLEKVKPVSSCFMLRIFSFGRKDVPVWLSNRPTPTGLLFCRVIAVSSFTD